MSDTLDPDQEIDYPIVYRTAPRSVKDPIHDLIPIFPKACAVIDTPQFQRLRYIKQLGTSYYVWTGASHNRFEHCLGVAYLSRLMAQHLKTNQPELGITDRDVECVELAGLCHDLGHGPWSHVWDGIFIPIALKGCQWKHEDGSEMMFNSLVDDSGIPFTDSDKRFIKALIAGDPQKCDPGEKSFLFDIVANKRNGIDVDKFDYIARDSHMVGEKGNLSLIRLIKSARVIENQICFDIKDANTILEICYTRFRLHKMIYNHKTAKAIEYMIIDGLLAAEEHLKIAERVFNAEAYLYLTDDIMPQIECSKDPELAASRAIFSRIRTRDLYKCVDFKVIEWAYRDIVRDYITPATVVSFAKNATLESGDDASFDIDELTEDHVIVDMSSMHYGMQDKNPLDFVKFYAKNKPNKCASAQKGDMTMLLPACFGEVMLRIYTKDARFFGIVQAGYRAALEAMQASMAGDTKTNVVPSTPPPIDTDTEGPSTPRSKTLSGQSSYTKLGIDSPKINATPTPLALGSHNSFTTVDKGYVPSPRIHKKPKSSSTAVIPVLNLKREGEKCGEGNSGEEPRPAKKKRR